MKPQPEIYTPGQRRVLIDNLLRHIPELPGVQAAGVAEFGPLGSRPGHTMIEAEPGHSIRAEVDWVGRGLFDAVGIPRVAGRDFNPADRSSSQWVAVVNQSLARAFFGHANPPGRSIRFPEDKHARPFEIVGVVGDTHYYDVHDAPQPGAWFPMQGERTN